MRPVKFFDRFNVPLLVSALGLITIGLVAIYSATNSNPDVASNFTKQLVAALFGVILVLIITFLPPRYISMSAYLLYVINILLLILVLFMGKKISGQTSWFSIAGFGVQPSEFAKVTSVLMLAQFLTNKQVDTDITRPRDFFIAILLGLFPVVLIMLQPDMGTSLVFLAMILPVLYWAGMPNYTFFVIVAPVVTAVCAFLGTYYFVASLVVVIVVMFLFKKNMLVSAIVIAATVISGLSVNYAYHKLQPYQQKRIVAVFNPESDALGSGYNVIQSKIAIGSGGMWGKGFLQGTQTQLKYIPEQWTDFIFCMVGEEFGFAGSIIVVILFLIFIWQTIHIAYLCKNKFLSICCIGFGTIITFHMLINLGMTMGIMPVIGIPLPFMSYGVSFLLANMCMLGVILNAYRNRKEYV
jgi:rod shape determining protein RodA